MTDINEAASGGNMEKFPSITKLLKEKGDKVVGQIITEPKELPVRKFIKGVPDDALFFQGNNVVPQSQLNLQIPYNAITQWVFSIQLKSGEKYTAWMDKDKKKALFAAINAGTKCEKGAMIAIEIIDIENPEAEFPKKIHAVQLRAPKGE